MQADSSAGASWGVFDRARGHEAGDSALAWLAGEGVVLGAAPSALETDRHVVDGGVRDAASSSFPRLIKVSVAIFSSTAPEAELLSMVKT